MYKVKHFFYGNYVYESFIPYLDRDLVPIDLKRINPEPDDHES